MLALLLLAGVGERAAQQRPQLLIYEGSSTDMGAMTAIGLLNRPAAARPSKAKPHFGAAYASFGWENHHSRDWLEEAVASDPQLQEVVLTNTSNSTAVVEHALSIGAAKGVVLYNSSEDVDLLPTVLTLCSVYDAVAIDCHRVPCGDPSAVLGKVLFDARRRWSNNLTAGAWAADNLLRHTASDDLMVVVDPNVISAGYLVDVAVSRKLFVMANKVCTPFSAASEIFERVSESKHWNRQHLLSIMGYNGAEEVLNLCNLRHDAISLVSDYVVNLSFLSLMTSFFGMPHAPLPAVAPPDYDASKVYVALIRSDGDNLQIVTGGQRDQMEHRRERCVTATAANRSIVCPPQTWTLSNRLLEFGPSVLRWWYEQAAATGRDSFLFGPSGYGYNWPSLIQPAAKQQQFADDTARDAAALQWPGCEFHSTVAVAATSVTHYDIHWDYATLDGDAIKAYISRLNSSAMGRDPSTGRPAIQAAFINFPTSLFIEEDHIGDVELFRCHQALDLPPANISQALNALAPGSTSFLYQVWTANWEPEEWMGGVAERVEFVGYRELIELRRQSRKSRGAA